MGTNNIGYNNINIRKILFSQLNILLKKTNCNFINFISVWELRCLIIHGLWYTVPWSWMNTQWPWFDLSIPPKVKCHGVNWKTIYDLLYRHFIQNFIRCSILEMQPLESYVTLLWYWKVIQGQMSWGKLIVHRWLPICVSNKLWPEHA